MKKKIRSELQPVNQGHYEMYAQKEAYEHLAVIYVTETQKGSFQNHIIVSDVKQTRISQNHK